MATVTVEDIEPVAEEVLEPKEATEPTQEPPEEKAPKENKKDFRNIFVKVLKKNIEQKFCFDIYCS